MPGKTRVQIPLWTIVTALQTLKLNGISGSDSSMDDCNEVYLIIAGVVIAGSDSSMDDCNPRTLSVTISASRVQIPLWTIVTPGNLQPPRKPAPFRFLYGRL